MNAVHIDKTRLAARTRGPVRGYALRALPWALAAAFFVHLMMERGLQLYRAGPALTHALEACLAAAVLIWVWRGLRWVEDLPGGAVGTGASYDYESPAPPDRAFDCDGNNIAPGIDCHGNFIGDRDYIGA